MDSAAVTSRTDALLMRDRMQARANLSGEIAPLPAVGNAQPIPQQQPVVQPVPIPRPITAEEQQPSVASLDRCKTLKERIYDRTTRPLPAADTTRDQYNTEVPFPVQTVYDMQRVQPMNPDIVAGSLPAATVSSPTEARQPGANSDTLLLPQEAAVVVRSLEQRLGAALQRNTVLEEDIETYRVKTDTAQTRQLTAERTVTELTARNDELQKQLEAVRSECQNSLLQGEKTNEGNVAKALEENTEKWQGVETQLRTDIGTREGQIRVLQTDKQQLEVLVKELKEQLAQNATSLQTSTSTIRELANELLGAKQQSSFISNGYKQIETQLKQANSLNHTQTTEIESLKVSLQALEGERDARAKAEAELKEAQLRLTTLEPIEKERERLHELTIKLERESGEKDRELAQLRQQVELVRSQANAAYTHANQFRMGGPQDPMNPQMMMSGGAGPMPGFPSANDPMQALRRELEEEERRVQEESRRWHANRASVPSPTRNYA